MADETKTGEQGSGESTPENNGIDFDSLSMDMDDGGEIVFSGPDTEDTPANDDESNDEGEGEETADDESETTDDSADDGSDDAPVEPEEKPDPRDSRIAKLESQMGELVSLLKEVIKKPESKATKADDSSDDDGDDDSDLLTKFAEPEGKQYLAKLIAKEVGKAIAPLKPVMQENTLKAELDATIKKYPDFKEYGNAIKGVLDAAPTLSFEQAYLIAKKTGVKPGKSGVAPKAKSQIVTPQQKKALQRKSAKLANERGVNPLETGRPKAKSLKEAFMQAQEDLSNS